MKQFVALPVVCAALAVSALAAAQQSALPVPPAGTLILMTGASEVELANDEAVASFFYEAQDADLTRAQSLVNQRVSDGTAALKRADTKAQVETSGYSSYPVYSSGTNRAITGWRVRQGVTVRTDNLAMLPKTVALAAITGVGRCRFPLSKAAPRQGGAQLIQLAYAKFQSACHCGSSVDGRSGQSNSRGRDQLWCARSGTAPADDDAVDGGLGYGECTEFRVRSVD